MKCDCLEKCLENREKDKNSTTSAERQSRRDRRVHKRLTQQAPKFFIPVTRIDLRFWKKTEDIVKENLDKYNYYPFGVVSPFGIYRLQYTQNSFWYGVAVGCALLLSFFGLLVWTKEWNKVEDERDDSRVDILSGGQLSIAGFATLCLFLFCWWMYSKSCIHTLYLDCQSLLYEIYRGGTLLYRGHFHNIYIKLKCLQTVKDKRERDKGDTAMYHLTLNGMHFEPIFISSHSKNSFELRRLGRRIAANFNLNFVDSEPVSKHHQIRHRCPYGVGFDDEDGFDSFFDVAEDCTVAMETRSSAALGARRTKFEASGGTRFNKSLEITRSKVSSKY